MSAKLSLTQGASKFPKVCEDTIFPGIPNAIKTMGVNITTIIYLRVLIIQIGSTIILMVVEAQGIHLVPQNLFIQNQKENSDRVRDYKFNLKSHMQKWKDHEDVNKFGMLKIHITSTVISFWAPGRNPLNCRIPAFFKHPQYNIITSASSSWNHPQRLLLAKKQHIQGVTCQRGNRHEKFGRTC